MPSRSTGSSTSPPRGTNSSATRCEHEFARTKGNGMEYQESTTHHQPSLGSESYNGTRGDSGSRASREAAQADADNGVTHALQLDILRSALNRGTRGVT